MKKSSWRTRTTTYSLRVQLPDGSMKVVATGSNLDKISGLAIRHNERYNALAIVADSATLREELRLEPQPKTFFATAVGGAA